MANKYPQKTEQKEFAKGQLLKKIKDAHNEISIIGATIFDLPWKEILESIRERFFNTGLKINILCESETMIAQYALLSQGSDDGSDNYSRGNLNGVKEKVLKELKEGLISYAVEKKLISRGERTVPGLEPVEDVKKKELSNVFEETFRLYMFDAISLEDTSSDRSLPELCADIKINIKKELSKKLRGFRKDIVDLFDDEKIADEIDNLGKFIENETESVSAIFSTPEILKALNTPRTYNIDKVLKEKGYTDCLLIYNYKNKPISNGGSPLVMKIGEIIKNIIQTTINEFRLTSNDDNIQIINSNYRLEAARKQAIRKASEKYQEELDKYRDDPKIQQRLFVKDCYMPIPVPMIRIDDELFITHALTKYDSIDMFQYVGRFAVAKDDDDYKSYWLTGFQNYYKRYFVEFNGAQRYSTEETIKGDRKEVIDIFNENRVRIGSGPRDAFLSNMSIVKSVVWALVFDRRGRILIHQRAANAKDNRDLWDKSVGGHIGVEDLDSMEAVKREIAEELFSIENEGQGGHDKIDWMVTNKSKIIYIGNWTIKRFPNLNGIIVDPDEYYLFSLNFPDLNKRNIRTEIIVTERVLSNNEKVRAKCFVDPYLCIVAENFDINKLENSNFALLTPNELKNCVSSGKVRLNERTRLYDSNAAFADFRVTSDLDYFVNSAIWDDMVSEFSKLIRENFKNEG
jgi:hypothetical protein